jgi:polysaccharide biosynthesis transport protein
MNKIPAALGFQTNSHFEAMLPGMPAEQRGEEAQPSIFREYLRIFLRWRRYLIGIIVAAMLVSLIITFLMTPMYRATSTLEIARESDKIVNIQGVQQEASDADQEFYQTQYGLLRSRTLAERVAVRTGLVDDPAFFVLFDAKPSNSTVGPSGRYLPTGRAQRQEAAGAILLKYARVVPARASRLVDVSFSSPDPALSAKVVNAWSSNFIDLSLERRYDATSYARRFLEDRLGQLRQRLERSERELVAFASRERIVDVPNESGNGARSLAAQDLSELNQALARATADRLQSQARFEVNSRGSSTATEALNNSAINGLRQRRAELSALYQKQLVQFAPGYPTAQEIARQVETIDRAITREEARVGNSLRTVVEADREREVAIRQRVDRLKDDLLNLRRRSIQYNIYQRDVDTNRQLYDGLLQRYKEIGVAGGIGVNNVSVVDAADVPMTPASPRLIVNLLLGFIAGTILGCITAYILEQSDESITDPEEVDRLVGLPLLGVVPRLVDVAPVDALADPKSELVDAYLAVQTSLAFSTDQGVPRSLAVTSTRPAEGKSTTALSLAVLLARSGKRVLLVDGDMRSPSVHSAFDLPNARGLSNLLAGDNDVAASIIHDAGFNVDVMPSGPLPPNAAELLTGPRFGALLDGHLSRYDHVVIDSPPVVGLADAPLIASRADAVVYAIEAHGIRFTMVKVALGRLAAAHARTLGVVLTKFEAQRGTQNFGYDYGYDYGRSDGRKGRSRAGR